MSCDRDPANKALTLAEYGVSATEAAKISGCGDRRTVQRLQKKARERGYDPAVSTTIEARFVEDAPRSGRPEVLTQAQKDAIEQNSESSAIARHLAN